MQAGHVEGSVPKSRVFVTCMKQEQYNKAQWYRVCHIYQGSKSESSHIKKKDWKIMIHLISSDAIYITLYAFYVHE